MPNDKTSKRKPLRRNVLLVAGIGGAVLMALFALALVIHFTLLSTARFNWLDPKAQAPRESR